MLVRDYCNMNVICCEPDAPIAEVAGLMRRHHVGDVIVVDGKGDLSSALMGEIMCQQAVALGVAAAFRRSAFWGLDVVTQAELV